jgi:adenine deaminase
LGLAEMMNYPGVVYGEADVLAKIDLYKDRVRDGHIPAQTGRILNAYKAAGIESDHECTTVEEAEEKLRAGMMVFIRQATMAQNLLDLLPVVTPENSRRICFCTDDRHPPDLIDDGSIDYMIRVAIEHGLDPVTAIRMATINPAEHFRLHEHGGIAPGFRADLMVFADLNAPHADLVYRGGRLVAKDGEALGEARPIPKTMRSTVNIRPDSLDFGIPAQGNRIRVIGSVDHQVVTEHMIMDAKIEDGLAVSDPARDILKMVVVERHKATGNIGKGFIHGIGLKRGALAGTVAHDHHNLVVVGVDDLSMRRAVDAVAEMGGGLVATLGDEVLATLPLPIGGLMSDLPIAEVREDIEKLVAVAHELGSEMHDPFMVMGFMALEVIPKLKLTDIGLVDVEQFKLVDLFVNEG